MVRTEWRRYRPECGLCCDNPAPGLHDLSNDVCGDYTRADNRSFCRKVQVQDLSGLCPSLVDVCVLPDRALGLGGWRMDPRNGSS